MYHEINLVVTETFFQNLVFFFFCSNMWFELNYIESVMSADQRRVRMRLHGMEGLPN